MFWGIVVATVAVVDFWLPALDSSLVWRRILAAIATEPGSIDALSTSDFAPALALLLAAVGLGLLAAFVVMHAAAIRISIWRARLSVSKSKDRKDFAQAYETQVLPRLSAHPLLWHAWKKFDETLLKDEVSAGGVIGNTIRPQSFIGYGLVRERLTGLKMLGSISGYFVGVGLLLTFIGIVLALQTASAPENFSDSDRMQAAMVHLLQIASFKFSTSIAGLGVSIVFAIFAKLIVIWIEGAFHRFCEAVERQLMYIPPQSITAEMNAVGKEQRDQLKEMASDRYFARLGEVIAPQMEKAVIAAMSPVTTQIGHAVEQMAATSQGGVADMSREFLSTLRGSAGVEMQGLGETLKLIQHALTDTQRGLQGSGEDFSRRLSEAAENLNRLVGEAGKNMGESAEQNRAGLQDVVEALRATFEKANNQIDADLGHAAAGASSKVEDAMGRVMERLETQLGTFMAGLSEFQAESTSQLAKTQEQVSLAQASAVDSIAASASEAAKSLQSGLVEALQKVGQEIDRLGEMMRSGAAAYANQASAISDATNQTRSVADAFAGTASEVRSATAPLAQSGERLAQASAEMNQSIARAAAALETSSGASTQLATALSSQVVRLGEMWAGYKAQFDQVDQALERAVVALGEATVNQSARLADFTKDTDLALSKVMERLQSSIAQIGENTAELSDTLDAMTKLSTRNAAE